MVCYIAFSYEKNSVSKSKYFKPEALESLQTEKFIFILSATVYMTSELEEFLKVLEYKLN